MSESFFHFTITCPYCGYRNRHADGYETDDWVEVFVFSGYSAKSAHNTYDPYYSCPECKRKIEIESLYLEKRIEPDSIDRVKQYLERMLEYIVERGGIYDHGWDPDILTAINRYAALEPENHDWNKLKQNYFRAIYDKKWFTKFEPAIHALEITRGDIYCHKLLKKVYLPSGLKRIGANTFKGCSSLYDIFVPDSVEIIEEGAFEASALHKIHLSNNLEKISNYMFRACYGLDKIFLSDKIKVIGIGAFEGCTGLRYQWLPAELERIEDYAFKGCTKLEKLKLPTTVEYIGKYAFEGCQRLTLSVKQGSYSEKYAQSHELQYTYDEA